MAANAQLSGEHGFGLQKFVKQAKGAAEVKHMVDQYKTQTSSSGSAGKNRTGNLAIHNRRSNPPPNSETGPARRLLNFQPKRTGAGFGKTSSGGSGDSNKNRNFNQVYMSGQRIGSSNQQHRSNSKE